MIVLFLVGMPCSGKTEIGKELFSRVERFTEMLGFGNRPVQFLEMSDIIRQVLFNLGHTKIDLSKAPMQSKAIYKALWNQIVLFPFSIVSGVREQFLIDSSLLTADMLKISSSRVRLPPLSVSIALNVPQETRAERFEKRHANKDLTLSFDAAEQRALDMQVPELMETCHIQVSYTSKSVSCVVDDIVSKLAYLVAGEVSSDESKQKLKRFEGRIEDTPSAFEFDACDDEEETE